MLELYILASGSSGNAAVVRNAGERKSALIDCGICKRDFLARCAETGVDPAEIEAVFVTHAHTDHTSGLGVVLRGLAKMGCSPALYTHPLVREESRAVRETADLVAQGELHHGVTIEIAGMTFTPFPTSHDAAGSTGFRIEAGGDAIGYLTDTGFTTHEAMEALSGVRILAIESNHDVAMLESGPYPYPLKRRILGERGHLSNDQCQDAVEALLHPGLEHVVAMHISEHNNTFDLPKLELERMLATHSHTACVHVALPRSPIRIL